MSFILHSSIVLHNIVVLLLKIHNCYSTFLALVSLFKNAQRMLVMTIKTTIILTSTHILNCRETPFYKSDTFPCCWCLDDTLCLYVFTFFFFSGEGSLLKITWSIIKSMLYFINKITLPDYEGGLSYRTWRRLKEPIFMDMTFHDKLETCCLNLFFLGWCFVKTCNVKYFSLYMQKSDIEMLGNK